MNYEFPIIRTIDDVLPHIKGREEFIVAEREFGTVINYQVEMSDTFPPIKVSGGSAKMREERALTNAMRRECRGLIFDKEGKIMSRPFHKFLNINQNVETQMDQIDITQPHIIMEKMDGSMIRPIFVNGELRLATKMGVTDVSKQAEDWLAKQSDDLPKHLALSIALAQTPLFEWVSPDNRIVVAYEDADLVYLGSRDNLTGTYLFDESMPFTHVSRYGSVNGNLDEYIARQRSKEGREGDIIRFNDGHMLKAKNDWYVRIHKVLDQCRFDRNIIALVLNEELDDVIGMVPEDASIHMRDLETLFWDAFKRKEEALLLNLLEVNTQYKGDRKKIALKYVPKLPHKADAQFIFRMIDGHDLRDMMIDYVKKQLTTNVKWDGCAEWLGM